MIPNGWWYYGPDAMTSTEEHGAAADGGRGGKDASPASAWAPFRHRLFAAMWGGQFVSNIGGWMQTVAAQWLMLTLTGSAAYVALVQTAAGLPVLLFAIVAGTAGDLVDRRRFLLGTQTFMLAAAAALGGLAIAGLVTPWVLLALVFAVGTGQALTSPTWQTLQPELVSPAERVQALSTLSSLYQLSMPRWIKARGMSFYLMVFQGGGAVGSAVMGLIAARAGLSVTLDIAAAGLALGPLAGLVWRFRPIPPDSLLPAGDWPEPQLAPDQTPEGPVLASVLYQAQAGHGDELMAAVQGTRNSRRRTGATSWRAWQDAGDPSKVLEEFVVASWDEHLLQHERITRREQDHLDRVRQLTDPAHPVTVTHWLAVPPRKPKGHRADAP